MRVFPSPLDTFSRQIVMMYNTLREAKPDVSMRCLYHSQYVLIHV